MAEARSRGGEGRGLRGYLRTRHDPLTSLVLVVPVFLVYHLGILFGDLRNGVDLVSGLTFELLRHSLAGYVAVTLGLAAGIVIAALALRRKGKLQPAAFGPVLVESVVWALVMLLAVGWATQQVARAQTGPPPLGPLDKLVMSAGAGFHEELVFRAGLFGGSAWALARVARLGPVVAPVVAALATSVVFSAIHYVGPLGDPFTIVSFASRFFAGAYLCALYRLRGFAVAVWAHTLYDVAVFFVLQ